MEFYLNGKTLLNNSILLSSAIGKNKDALFCLTNFSDCCKYPIIKGQWIFPNQTDVLPLFYGNSFYRSRHSSSIILHQKSTDGLNSHTGIYTCSIPDSSEKYQNLYIHIADCKHEQLLKNYLIFVIFMLQISLTSIFQKYFTTVTYHTLIVYLLEDQYTVGSG